MKQNCWHKEQEKENKGENYQIEDHSKPMLPVRALSNLRGFLRQEGFGAQPGSVLGTKELEEYVPPFVYVFLAPQ